ncbi:unnamed protein product, partial [Discosporangium mesarthrocarpum]
VEFFLGKLGTRDAAPHVFFSFFFLSFFFRSTPHRAEVYCALDVHCSGFFLFFSRASVIRRDCFSLDQVRVSRKALSCRYRRDSDAVLGVCYSETATALLGAGRWCP